MFEIREKPSDMQMAKEIAEIRKERMPMTIFEAVKAEVPPRMAAERYGLHVSRVCPGQRVLSQSTGSSL